jgi:hypothetical protein
MSGIELGHEAGVPVTRPPWSVVPPSLYSHYQYADIEHTYGVSGHLCGLMARVPAADTEVSGSIPGAVRFSE